MACRKKTCPDSEWFVYRGLTGSVWITHIIRLGEIRSLGLGVIRVPKAVGVRSGLGLGGVRVPIAVADAVGKLRKHNRSVDFRFISQQSVNCQGK